jgi:hypothetical protein
MCASEVACPGEGNPRRQGLRDASYAAAEKAMGPEHLVALVAAIGAFSMTCITAGTFQIDPPADDPVPLAG